MKVQRLQNKHEFWCENVGSKRVLWSDPTVHVVAVESQKVFKGYKTVHDGARNGLIMLNC